MIIDIFAGFLSGLLGSLGLGGGGVLIIYLTMMKHISQTQAQGINLIFFIPIAIMSVILHSKNDLIDWKIAVRYILYGLVGIIIGSLLINLIDESILSRLFSIILISIGIKEFLSKKDE